VTYDENGACGKIVSYKCSVLWCLQEADLKWIEDNIPSSVADG